MELPPFARARRLRRAGPAVVPRTAVVEALQEGRYGERIGRGTRVVVAAGSRGIAELTQVLRATVEFLHSCGAEVVIVPAMGSHGGATAEGQLRVLESLGVRQDTVGAPIQSSMETVKLGTTTDGRPVYADRIAAAADHVVLVNRVAPHPEFAGPVQSGLMKMAVFGLGKQRGAESSHNAVTRGSFEQVLRAGFEVVRRHMKVLCGVAVIEDGYGGIARVEAVPSDAMGAREPYLLEEARGLRLEIPSDPVDLLIIDEIGKDISGAGMDLGIVGRKSRVNGARLPDGPRIMRIAVRGLSTKTAGNATGIGLADMTHARVVRAMDRATTYMNCLTANGPVGAAMPMYFDSDRELLETALDTTGVADSAAARVVWIRNTKSLQECLISAALVEEVESRGDVEIAERGIAVPYDDAGNVGSPLSP